MEHVINTYSLFKERFKNAKQITPIQGWKLSFGSKRRKSFGNGWLLVGDAAGLNLLKIHLDPELQETYKMQRWGKHKWLLNYIIGRAVNTKRLTEP